MAAGIQERAAGGASAEAPPVLTLDPAPPDVRPLPLCDDAIGERPAWRPPAHERRVRLALLAFACLLFLPNLGAFGLWDPWETHYGAVTTDMLETRDWVSTWWGYKEAIGPEPAQGSYFFSKPIFIFWSEGFFANLIGRGEWAIRLPMAVLAILAVMAIYWAVSILWSRSAGLWAAVVTATAPQFFMISRQAQTDMPFVATMVIANCFLMMAIFGPRIALTRRGFWAWVWGTAAFVLLNVLPQLGIIGTDLDDFSPGVAPEAASGLQLLGWHLQQLGQRIQLTGWFHVAIYATVLAGTGLWFALQLRRDLRREGLSDAVKDRWLRRCHLVLFYVMIAQSTYAKGLLGFALPGLIILIWLVFTAQWRILGRVELVRGVLITLVVGLPWYVAMFARHGWAYYQRFFIHDHFNRLAAGVHQIDSGNFEHFIKWLGIGIFPWAAFAPLAVGWLFRQDARDARPETQARLFVSFWFLGAFMLFTLSSTKFHHYIFPALPPLAILIGLFLVDLLKDRSWLPRLAALIAVLLFATMVRDLHEDPQHIRNLMTYKYDRPLPDSLPIDADAPVTEGSSTTWRESTFWKHTSPSLQAVLTTPLLRYETWIRLIALAGLLALGLFFFARTRRAGLVGLGLVASALTAWSLSYYMPSLSPHWSQKYLFDAYYDDCHRVPNSDEVEDAYTPVLARIGLGDLARSLRWETKFVCEEDVISWRITWRGETYYSWNELQPIEKEDTQFMPYLEERNHGKTFYVLMERGKMSGFKSKLESYSTKLRRKGTEGFGDIDGWDVSVVNDESLYFQMVKAAPRRDGSGG